MQDPATVTGVPDKREFLRGSGKIPRRTPSLVEISRLAASRRLAQTVLMRTPHVMRSRLRPLLSSGVITFALVASAAPARGDSDQRPTPAVDAPQPLRALTMTEALGYAREHQPAIRAALARVAERIEEAKVPGGQWLPTVAVTGQIFAMTANNTTGTFVQPDYMDLPRIGGTRSPAAGSWSPFASTLVGGGLRQEVFDFGRIGAQRAAADAQVELEKHRADTDRLDVDFGVEEAFFSVLAAKSIVKASDDAYERSRVHRDLAKRGVDSGLRSPIELTRAEADLDRFDVGRVRARGGVAVAQSVLSAAIGALDAATDTAGEPPTPVDMPALSEALRLARERDPRLAETLAQLRAAEQTTRAVGSEMRPDLSLTATLSGRAGGAPPSAGPTANGNGWIPNVANWDAGLVITWPLFDGVLSAQTSAARSLEQVRREEIDVRTVEEAAEVRKTYVQVQIAGSALTSLRNTVVAAQANYEQADARFRAGIGNAVELADAETVRTDAEIQLALGQFELARARAAFGRAIAEGL
jgi:outer membrane protein